jgi:cellulose synthase/poly-beta-1,6-N-acetylglucosamine synthase-like glycosyltransferase
MNRPFVSVCIITGGNLAHLDACLSSIQTQAEAPAFEVIVCSNGGPDVAQLVRSRFPSSDVGHVARTLLGAARNHLVERAKGEWLLFLDDDVTIEPWFLAKMAKIAKAHPEASVLGGPNDTPPGTPPFPIIQGAVLASIAVSGPVRRRYGAHPAGPADERFFTLCNLAVRREAMVDFPNDLVGAEENAVLSEMHDRGLLMHYDPELAAFHERRSTFRSFAEQMVKYGLGRGQLTRRSLRTLRPAYAVPSLFLVYLLAASALAAFQPLVLVPLVLYAGAVGATAFNITWGLRDRPPGHLATLVTAGMLILTVHLGYGMGFLQGLVTRFRPAEQGSPVWSDPVPAVAPAPAATALEFSPDPV